MIELRKRHEWMRFLDARSGEEAAAALAIRVRHLDAVYDEVCALVPPLHNCPDGDIPAALGWARSSIAEAAGMLASVKAQFDDDERGAA